MAAQTEPEETDRPIATGPQMFTMCADGVLIASGKDRPMQVMQLMQTPIVTKDEAKDWISAARASSVFSSLPGAGRAAWAVYRVLLTDFYNFKDGACRVTIDALSKRANYSPAYVTKAIAALEQRGVISRIKAQAMQEGRLVVWPSLYVFHQPPKWIEGVKDETEQEPPVLCPHCGPSGHTGNDNCNLCHGNDYISPEAYEEWHHQQSGFPDNK